MTKKVVIITVENTSGFKVGDEITLGSERFLVEKVIDFKKLEVSSIEELIGEREWELSGLERP